MALNPPRVEVNIAVLFPNRNKELSRLFRAVLDSRSRCVTNVFLLCIAILLGWKISDPALLTLWRRFYF